MNRLLVVQLRDLRSAVVCVSLVVGTVLVGACSSSDGGDEDPSSPDGVTVIDGPAQVDDDNGGAELDG